MKKPLFILMLLLTNLVFAQNPNPQIIKTLFLGNSYTYVNNLPLVTAAIATSMGDSLIYDSYAPGGYTLQGHSTDPGGLNKIMAGGWDYVVLQEQSQIPSFPLSQVQASCFPYAHKLDSIILQYNPCAETMFYMTWGRKNGDASNCVVWPPVCTYEGMDSLLHLRYMMLANDNHAAVSPVGALWHYIRQNFPNIELYNADESHPSPAGTYAGACSFYAAMFRNNPELITYNPGIDSTDAANIRAAAKAIVYDSLPNWNIGTFDPIADFNYNYQGGNQVAFSNLSTNATNYYWSFGDGDTSSAENPVHTYFASGNYLVMLISSSCNKSDTILVTVNAFNAGISEQTDNKVMITPNPNNGTFNVGLASAERILGTKIYNYQGKLIAHKKMEEISSQIALAEKLSPGIYFLEINLAGNSMFCKFIVAGN